MPDVKKLTVTFITAAVVVALIASYFSFHPKPVALEATQVANIVPSNAFAAGSENLPSSLQQNLSGTETNITVAAANNIAQVILALNPQGPQTAGSQTGFVIPTSTALEGYLAVEDPQFSVADLWNSPSGQLILSAPDQTPSANQNYVASFKKILGATISSPSFLSEIQQENIEGDAQDVVNNSTGALSNAIQQLEAVPVPAPFEQFDKDFLVYLENQRNVMSVIANNANDPAKSMIVLNDPSDVEQEITNNFSAVLTDTQNLNLNQLLGESSQNPFAQVASTIFSIPVADADNSTSSINCNQNSSFNPPFDPLSTNVPVMDQTTEANTANTLLLLIYECEDAALTQQSKANEINVMNSVELSNIQNNGDPDFITNYEEYFQDAADQGATQAYQQVSNEVCPQLQPYVNEVYTPSADDQGTDLNSDIISQDDNNGGNDGSDGGTGDFGSSQVNGTGSNCAVGNSTDWSGYYDDFTSDPNAWSDYLNFSANPDDNSFGATLQAEDQINAGATSQAAAANAQSIANQGYKSSVECTNSYTTPQGDTICDQTQINTPGNTYASLIQTAADSGYATILNSNDASQIDSELANSFGVQLAQNGPGGLASLNIKTQNSLSDVCKAIGSQQNGAPNPAFTNCSNMVGKISADLNQYINIFNSLPSSIQNLF